MSAPDPIELAKADIVQLDKKINSLRAEESRLEMQRKQFEHERDRVRAFVEMYGRYAEGSVAQGELKTAPPLPPKSAPEDSTKPQVGETAHVQKKARRRGKGSRPKIERKPKSAPTMPEMIRESLKEAKKQGKSGLEPIAILEFVRARYWPHARGKDVGPTAWRMWHDDGELKKEGMVYSLPDTTEKQATQSSVVAMRR